MGYKGGNWDEKGLRGMGKVKRSGGGEGISLGREGVGVYGEGENGRRGRNWDEKGLGCLGRI